MEYRALSIGKPEDCEITFKKELHVRDDSQETSATANSFIPFFDPDFSDCANDAFRKSSKQKETANPNLFTIMQKYIMVLKYNGNIFFVAQATLYLMLLLVVRSWLTEFFNKN
jgi:hypothetical protein